MSLGRHPPPNPTPRVQKPASDAGVESDRVCELSNVCAGDFGNFCHGIDEADFGGEERVRRHLHELCCRIVGDDERSVCGDGGRIDLVEQRRRVRTCFTSGHSVDEAIGDNCVLHGEPFAQKLGVPGKGRTGGRCLDDLSEAGSGSDRNGALPDDEAARGEMRKQ